MYQPTGKEATLMRMYRLNLSYRIQMSVSLYPNGLWIYVRKYFTHYASHITDLNFLMEENLKEKD